MKILITERQSKLIERVIDNEVFCDKCNWNWSLDDGGNDPFICHKCGYDNLKSINESDDEILDNNEPNVFTYTSLRSYSVGTTKLKYFNNLLPLEYDPSIPDKVKLLDINDNETYIVDKSEIIFGKDNYGNINGRVKEDYFLKKFPVNQNNNQISNIKEPKKVISPIIIRSSLKSAFPEYWVEKNNVFTAGLRGIYKIGDYLKPKTDEDWSILNYFDTKNEIKTMIYNELLNRNLPLNDLISSISTIFKDKDFMGKLVERQWKSIVSGEQTEINSTKNLVNFLGSNNVKRYFPGEIMDRYEGVDVTIDGINYQVKPLKAYTIDENGDYVITTYGMKIDYLKKKLINKIVFCNDQEILIFDNKNYTVPAHYLAIFKEKPEIVK
jgi:hypothetical protein